MKSNGAERPRPHNAFRMYTLSASHTQGCVREVAEDDKREREDGWVKQYQNNAPREVSGQTSS